jgi:peptide/nickel transport system substrate-binding protein
MNLIIKQGSRMSNAPRLFWSAICAAALAASPAAQSATKQPKPTQPRATKRAPRTQPASTTVVAASSAPKSALLKVALAFPPRAGLSVTSDDAFLLTRLGVAETLVKADGAGNATPLLATAWEQVNPTTWRFTLRKGVQFHDGTALDGASVARALSIVGAATTPPRSVRGIGLRAVGIDASTVEVTTSRPDPLVPLRLSSPGTAILASSAYASIPPRAIGTGTGPFRIDSVNDQRILTGRFDSYWGGKAKLSGVEARLIADPIARTNALRSGEIDLAEGVPSSQVAAVRGDSKLDVLVYDLPRTTTLYLNTAKAPFNQLAYRQAVDQAIDRKALAAQLLDNAAAPGAGYFGPAVAWDPDVNVAAANPKAALAAVAKAGLPDTVRLWTYPARAELPEIATALQAMLFEGGFETKITVAEYDSLEPKVLAGEFDMFLLSRSYMVDVPDPAAFLISDFTCAGGYNLNRYCSSTFDSVVAPLATTVDRGARTKIFAEAAKILERDVIGVPILHDKARIGISTSVKGLIPDPLEQRLITTEVTVG